LFFGFCFQAGKKIRATVGASPMIFFVSPFTRTRQTLRGVMQSFEDTYVLICACFGTPFLFLLTPPSLCFLGSNFQVIEKPEVREQEWGNLQDETKQTEILNVREKVGKFFYRFPNGESGPCCISCVAFCF
jgi:hypothetical protein